MLSVFYILSVISIICILFFLPKSCDKQEISIWIPMCYIAYECIISLIASIFTIIHIPVNLLSLGTANIMFAVIGAIWIKRTGNIQNYFFKIENMIFFLVIVVIVIAAGYERYGDSFQICFETSDPANHFKFAMDTVNNQSVITSMSTMFVAPFTNGVFIRILSPFFEGANTYKAFIIKELVNFGLSAAVFYSYIYKHLKTFVFRLFGMGLTLFYLFGYPYNNMLFGFSYLGFAVTIITFLLFIVDIYLNSKKKNEVLISFISLGCFGAAECYTFFAPFVFIGVFICVAYKNRQENGYVILSKQFYIDEFKVFFWPTLLTIWFTIIYPRFFGSGLLADSDYVSALTAEGYIYRNLYADFIIYLPFALYAVSRQKKRREFAAGAFMFLSLLVYMVISFLGMCNGVISTYYYYKLNFAAWMLLLSLFVEGICDIYANSKEAVIFYCGCWSILFLLWFTRLDARLSENNVLFNPFPNAKCCFEVYDYNRIIRERKTCISPELIQLCQKVNVYYKNDSQMIMYLGNWLDNYWYEALTNQRQNTYCFSDPAGFAKNFADGAYGDYLSVAKNDESLADCYSLLQNYEVVYENSYGIIIKRQ